jgi:enamine deaminase RidA (YjgF/YER057c/UK114 family)
MPRQIVFTSNAAKAPATYSEAVKAAGLVFVSGTAPQDPDTGAIKGATIQEQTRQCLTNISAILEAAGSSVDRSSASRSSWRMKRIYRLRVGEWRVIFAWQPPDTLMVTAVGSRQSIYRR